MMNWRSTAFTWFHGRSLRAELAIGFVAVIALTLIVGAVSLLAQYRSVRAVDELLTVDGRLAELSVRSNVAMLKARRAEKDFLLFQSEFGFNEARSRYTTLFRTSLADVRQYMADVRELVSDPGLVQQTRAIEQAIGGYESGFLQIVALYGELGHVNTGLEGRFRESAREMESIVTAQNSDRLMIDL